ncbi:MAG TPA: GDSL-type esterase/lipase family protein [Nitrolancea sp.]|nr:GDSL-type esterase/lipase family protein [Nitrolancea sp.]
MVMRLARPRFIAIFVLVALISGAGLFWWSTHDARSAAEPPVYVALGASDAVGVGADQPMSEGWVPLVRRSLPDDPQLVNLGISGATLSDVINQELPVALDARPAWVTLWPGINDLRHDVRRETFATNLDALLERLNRQTTARLIVLNIPDLRLVPAFASVDPVSLDQTVREWNDVIAHSARQQNAILVDLYGHSAEIAGHDEDISSDGFHPSTAGYRRIADLVMKTVDAHGAASTP